MACVFLTGASGFMGRRLAAELLRRGHRVRAPGPPRVGIARRRGMRGRRRRPAGRRLLPRPRRRAATPSCTWSASRIRVPAKAAQFRSIDLASAKAAISAATSAGVRHFVYVSVAHPAPVMRAYIAARVEAEEAIRASGLPATIVRPWYVLGPGPPVADAARARSSACVPPRLAWLRSNR